MATILVTGGCGFIGSHVARTYLANGHRVAVVDDLSTGRRELLPPGAEFFKVDVRDAALEQVFATVRPDVVNHHAAQISVLRSVREPQIDAAINVVGSVNVLECAAKHGVKRFIFASTGGALYGEPQRLPCDETHPIAPLSAYGTAKYCVEQYIGYYSRMRALPSVILRYANVFGPDQDPHGEAGVVAIFTNRMLANEQAFIFGTGEQERDFVYVGDVAQASLLALERGEGKAYNIGTGIGSSVNRLYQILAEATSCKLPPAHKPANAGEVFKITLDASKARKELGWRPTVTFEKGLQETVRSFAAKKRKA